MSLDELDKTQRKPFPGKRRKIFIVDDHAIVCEGLAQLLNQEQDFVTCGFCESYEDALQTIPLVMPDAIIVDLTLKEGLVGIELIKDIKSRYSDIPILVLSAHDELTYAERTLRAGAKGYVMKEKAPTEIKQALRQILRNKSYVSDEVTNAMVQRLSSGNDTSSPIETLSDRELQILEFIGRGHSTRDISEKLHLSVKTIETYRSRIKEKLAIKDSTKLIWYAVEWLQKQQNNKKQ